MTFQSHESRALVVALKSINIKSRIASGDDDSTVIVFDDQFSDILRAEFFINELRFAIDQLSFFKDGEDIAKNNT